MKSYCSKCDRKHDLKMACTKKGKPVLGECRPKLKIAPKLKDLSQDCLEELVKTNVRVRNWAMAKRSKGYKFTDEERVMQEEARAVLEVLELCKYTIPKV